MGNFLRTRFSRARSRGRSLSFATRAWRGMRSPTNAENKCLFVCRVCGVLPAGLLNPSREPRRLNLAARQIRSTRWWFPFRGLHCCTVNSQYRVLDLPGLPASVTGCSECDRPIVEENKITRLRLNIKQKSSAICSVRVSEWLGTIFSVELGNQDW